MIWLLTGSILEENGLSMMDDGGGLEVGLRPVWIGNRSNDRGWKSRGFSLSVSETEGLTSSLCGHRHWVVRDPFCR